MSTLATIKALIDTNIPDNNTGLITPAKEREVMKALADFVVSSQGESDATPFVWDSAFSYSSGDPVIYQNAWYLSLVGSNLNNQPDESPTEWDPVNAFNTVLSIWEQDAVYLGELTIVIRENKLYLLDRNTVGSAPYVSTDFPAELAAGDWINLLPDSTPLANTYADTTAMIAGQGSQVSGYLYRAGTALYIYLGTTTGTISDYYEVSDTAATVTPPVAAEYADQAAMIAAQGGQMANFIYYDGTDYWQYLGTTAGTIADYRKINAGVGGISHAPSDGSFYASRNGTWESFAPGISHATSDGSFYASRNGAWEEFTPGIQHATSDGNFYASKDGAWTAFIPFTVAGTPNEGDVVTWVSGVPTWAAPSGGGGSSLWTEGSGFIYRDGPVVIGRTTLPFAGFFVVQSNTTVNNSAFVHILNEDGSDAFLIKQGGSVEAVRNFAAGTTGVSNIAGLFRSQSDTAGSVGIRVQNQSGTTLFTVEGNSKAEFPSTVVGIYCGPLSNFSLNVQSQNAGGGILWLRNSTGSNVTQIQNDGGYRTLASNYFGRLAAPGARVHIRGAGTGTTYSLISEDSSGAANVRFIDNGNIDFLRLPTSDPLVAGRLWNDAGTVKISAG